MNVLINYSSTVRLYSGAIQIPWRSVISWKISVQ